MAHFPHECSLCVKWSANQMNPNSVNSEKQSLSHTYAQHNAIQVLGHTRTDTHTHTRARACARTYTRAQTHTHTRAQTHTHTHTQKEDANNIYFADVTVSIRFPPGGWHCRADSICLYQNAISLMCSLSSPLLPAPSLSFCHLILLSICPPVCPSSRASSPFLPRSNLSFGPPSTCKHRNLFLLRLPHLSIFTSPSPLMRYVSFGVCPLPPM